MIDPSNEKEMTVREKPVNPIQPVLDIGLVTSYLALTR